MVRSRLSVLFFSQVCLLAAVAGVLAFRYPGPGFLLLGLVWLLDLPRSGTPGRVFFLALAFAGAALYTDARFPVPPPVPAWLEKASAPTEIRDGKEQPPEAVRVRGRVVSGTPLPGNRLRLVLEHVSPADGPAAVAEADVSGSAPYRGRIVWTWYRSGFAPLPGQGLEATIRLSPVRGTKNPGVWDIDRYWQDRDVWFRAWSGSRADVVFLESDAPGLPSGGTMALAFANARQDLLNKFLAALPGYTAPAGQPLAASLPEASAMLPALIFGDRSFLSAEQSDLVARSTLAHSLALSGLHLGYAVLAGVVLAYGIGLCFPRLWLRVPRPLAALVLAVPLAGAYLWLGQMPLSLMRAACMLLFWTILLILKRPKALLDGLLAAVTVLLLLDPLSLFDLSLQLSVLSVAVIALSLPLVSRFAHRLFPDRTVGREPGQVRGSVSPPAESQGLFRRLKPRNETRKPVFPRFLHWAVTLLGISFCIQAALLPLTARAFGTTGLWFPLNLIWLPALGFLVMPPAFLGLVFAGLGWEASASAALYIASLPCEGLMALLHWLDGTGLLLAPLMPRPHWLSSAGFWLLCLSLSALMLGKPGTRRGTTVFVLAGLVMLLIPPGMALYTDRQPGVRLRLLDVGQGQSVLVEWSGLAGAGSDNSRPAGRALIDGGGLPGGNFDVGESIVGPVLTDNALPRLDMVINTHPDADHLAGLMHILERFTVGRYLTNGDRPVPALEKREQAVLERSGLVRRVLAAGDRLALGSDLRLEVLWPTGEWQKIREPGEEKGNNASLILRLVWRDKGLALLCGDAEAPALKVLLAETQKSSDGTPLLASDSRPDSALAAQVLVVPHHGSGGSLVPGFYEAVRPELAMASCGYANKWGFPSPAVRNALRTLGIAFHDTAESGQIQVVWRNPDEPPDVVLARTANADE